MPERRFDLLVAGEINPDLILTDLELNPTFGQVETLVEDAALTIGSSSVIFACGAARLGLKVCFVGVCGDDLFGKFMLKEMETIDIDISNVIVDPNQKTGISVILNKITDRAILTHLGSINALTTDQIPDDLLIQSRHLHIASFFLQTNLRPGVLEIFQRARQFGISTSLDTNWDPDESWEGVLDVLHETTIFFPNEREAAALSGETSPDKVLTMLSSYSNIVAMKMGASGGIAQRGDNVVKTDGIEVDVIDTVGAGDSFDAGFIYGFLNEWTLGKTLNLAVACGSLSTTAPGGTAGQPTLDEALTMARGLNDKS